MTLEIAGLSIAIGVLLGLLGGGGSILTVPMLVYMAHLEPKAAIATSLLAVGATSAVAILPHARRGNVCWGAGAAFGTASMIGAYGGGRLAAWVPGHILMLLFAGMMLATGGAMLLKRQQAGPEPANSCPGKGWVLLAIALLGIAVGALTGLVGAGGGFVVVPALGLLVGLPMRGAIGTSLLIIAANSFAGLAGYLSHVRIDLEFAGAVTAVTVLGSLIGGWLAPKVSAAALRRGFALFVIAVALYLLQRELDIVELIRRLAIPCHVWGVGSAVVTVVLLQQLGSRLRAGHQQEAGESRENNAIDRKIRFQ